MGTDLTRIQWIAIFTTAAVNIFCAASVSIQAPFYPAEAERKGATATEYGIVFGTYELTNFFVSPLFGKIVEKYGVRPLLSGGMMVSSIALILFGLLDYVEHRVYFIGLSILLRVLESVGAASAVVSGFSLIGIIFPDNVATVFATMETFYGAGFIIAPTFGGFLYSFGGFPFPFICVGIMGFIISISILLLLPSTTEPQKRENCKTDNDIVKKLSSSLENNQYKVMEALKIPAIALNSICTMMFALSMGFYSAVLEPHLRQFHLSTQVASLFFTIIGGTYAVVSPFMGRLADKVVEPSTLVIIGCFLVICSYTIIGPAPFIPLPPTIPVCVIALVIEGLAFGAGNVATFTDAFRSARKAGYPNAVGTYGLVSGIWTSAFALGGFIGPSGAGILYDLYGFRWATQFVSASFILLLIVVITFVTVTRRKNNKYEQIVSDIDERTPILTASNQ